MSKILALAQQTLSAKALVGAIYHLRERGHQVTVYSTGNSKEAKPFLDIGGAGLVNEPWDGDLNFFNGYDLVITGSGRKDSDEAKVTDKAWENLIPTVRVMTRNNNYANRFADNHALPTKIAVMDKTCKRKLKAELQQAYGRTFAADAAGRVEIVGWTAFDYFAEKKANWNEDQRAKLVTSLQKQGYGLPEKLNVYFSQNTKGHGPPNLAYERVVSELIAKEFLKQKIPWVVKPHPGEDKGFIQSLAGSYGGTFIPADSCNTDDLMFSADSIIAGRSTTLAEGCLAGKNTGGFLPGIEDVSAFPSLATRAIPYATSVDELENLIGILVSPSGVGLEKLAKRRKRFQVDGRAGERLADLVESLL